MQTARKDVIACIIFKTPTGAPGAVPNETKSHLELQGFRAVSPEPGIVLHRTCVTRCPKKRRPFHLTENIPPIQMNTPPCVFQVQPICDRIGYKQHDGECWADTLQQILFFADGFRETTQKLFYFITDAEIETLVDTYLEDVKALFADPELYEPDAHVKHRNESAREDMITILHLFKVRFKSHYDMLACDHPYEDEVCIPPELLRRKYESLTHILETQLYGQVGRAAVGHAGTLLPAQGVVRLENLPIYRRQLSGKTSTASSKLFLGKEKSGAPLDFTVSAFKVLLKLCNIPSHIFSHYEKIPNDLVLQAIIVRHQSVFYNVYPSGKADYVKKEGHITGFLKCSKNWYYYDDNHGIFPVDASLITYFFRFYKIRLECRKILTSDIKYNKKEASEALTKNIKEAYKVTTAKAMEIMKQKICIKIVFNMVWVLLINEQVSFEEQMPGAGIANDNYEILYMWSAEIMKPPRPPLSVSLRSCTKTQKIDEAKMPYTEYSCYSYVTSMHMVTLPSTYVENQAKTSAYVAAGQMVVHANNEIVAENLAKENIPHAYKTMMAPYESEERRNTKSRRRIVRRKSVRRRRPTKN